MIHRLLPDFARRWRAVFFLAVALLGTTSCDPDRVFEENHDLKDAVWPVGNRPVFTFAITDTAARYRVALNVRTTTSYQFYNLFVKLTLTDPAGRRVSRLLHELNVRSPETGQPLGNGAGDIFDLQVAALRNLRLAQSGTYRIELEQYMRVGTLPDVMAVGVRVARETPTKPAP